MEQCYECLEQFQEDDLIIAECGVLCITCSEDHECSICWPQSDSDSTYEPSEVSESGQSCGDSAAGEDFQTEEDPKD